MKDFLLIMILSVMVIWLKPSARVGMFKNLTRVSVMGRYELNGVRFTYEGKRIFLPYDSIAYIEIRSIY